MSTYKLWHEFLPHVPKSSRYTIGEKIDALLVAATELILTASYLGREQKLPYVQRAAIKIDMVKFFLQILWEIKAMDTKRYIAFSEKYSEIGRMLGGWARQLGKQNPARGGE